MVRDVVAGFQEDLIGHVPTKTPTPVEAINAITQVANVITASNTTQDQMLHQMHKMMQAIQLHIANGSGWGGGGRVVYDGLGCGPVFGKPY